MRTKENSIKTSRYFFIFLLSIIMSGLLGFAFTLFTPPRTTAQTPVTLTISAAASLSNAMNEIKPLYQKIKTNTNLTYNFGSSGSLQQQIEQGAPVDIFFSAATKQMDALASKKLILSETRKNLLSNQMVLITPKRINFITKFQDLTKPQVKRIAIGEVKSVPAGQYGEQVLKYYKLWEKIKSKIVYGKDVRAVLTYVESGNVEAGIVYRTDAKTSKQVTVVATAPSQSHSPIIYPVAVIKNSKKANAAKDFIQFLSSRQAKGIFEKYGFKVN